MNASRRDELRRAVGHTLDEARRFEREVLGDLELTTRPTGLAPDAALREVVRVEREHLRAFGRVLIRRAAELRGGR